MLDWIMSNKALCVSMLIGITGIVVAVTEKSVHHNDGMGTVCSGTIAPFIQDCREDTAGEQLVDLPGATGHAQIFGGSGAGCLSMTQSLPSGGLHLAEETPARKPLSVAHGKRYLLAHHPLTGSTHRHN